MATTTTDRRSRTRMLTIQDVAADLKLSIKTVRRLIERGELRVHRIGRSIRVPEEELTLFVSRVTRA